MSKDLRNNGMKGWATACTIATVLLWLSCAACSFYKGLALTAQPLLCEVVLIVNRGLARQIVLCAWSARVGRAETDRRVEPTRLGAFDK